MGGFAGAVWRFSSGFINDLVCGQKRATSGVQKKISKVLSDDRDSMLLIITIIYSVYHVHGTLFSSPF